MFETAGRCGNNEGIGRNALGHSFLPRHALPPTKLANRGIMNSGAFRRELGEKPLSDTVAKRSYPR